MKNKIFYSFSYHFTVSPIIIIKGRRQEIKRQRKREREGEREEERKRGGERGGENIRALNVM